MKCNLYAIKFTHLKCTIHCFLVYLRSCATITKSLSLEHFCHSRKRNPASVNSHFLFLPTPSLRQPLISFCCYRFPCFFHFSYKCSHVIMVFCDCLHSLSKMFSRCIYVVAWISTSFLLFNNISLNGCTTFYPSIQLFMDIWVASSFELLWIMLFEHLSVSFCVNIYFKFSWAHT